METKSPWPLALKYALVLAFSYIAINLVFYLINPDASNGEWSLMGTIQLLITLLVWVYVLYIAAKARREQDLNGEITYGQSLGFMMITSLPATFIVGLYAYVFAAYIAPEIVEKAWNMQAEKMSQKGMSDEEIDQAMKIAHIFRNPAIMIFGSMIWQMVISLLLGLIVSIFTKKDPKTFE